MTWQEAVALKPGQRVRIQAREGWRTVEVVSVYSGSPRERDPLVWVRRPGRARNGALFGKFDQLAHELYHLPDNVTANVYADWLEEHGEHSAARKLRQAFPMSESKGA